MDRTRFIVVILIALLAVFATTSQAQPVAVTELAVDSSPPMIATDTDCPMLTFAQSAHVGKIINDTSTLSDMPSPNTIEKYETSAGTLRHRQRDILSVNIGFQTVNAKTQGILNISSPISFL
ncbi:MAG: hypothetical protein KAS32_03115 [Candidatus Peribacteraceae bacterium]|nr:hypothetical protein [Candidatus Peribacteraceae bacterium]